jgi:hypothetical protein
MEHELFTDRASRSFHLAEELGHRQGLTDLPAADQALLAGDIKRTTALSTMADPMRDLKTSYPYLLAGHPDQSVR